MTLPSKPKTMPQSNEKRAAIACQRLVRLGVWFWNLRHWKTARAYRNLTRAMQEDSDYAHAWQCNIACSLIDEGMSHKDANKAADRLMAHLFNVKMNVCQQAPKPEPENDEY